MIDGMDVLFRTLVLVVLTTAAEALAGPPELGSNESMQVAPERPGWLDLVKPGGYLHFQAGGVSGRDFWYDDTSDWRRGRVNLRVRAFDAFETFFDVNLVSDDGASGGGVEIGYQSIFTGWGRLDLSRWFDLPGVDRWSIAYGKRKLSELNEEVDTSINSILTVERSSLAAQLAPFRAGTGTTGIWGEADFAGDSVSLGLFSTDASPEFADWDEGLVVIGGWRRTLEDRAGFDRITLALGGGWQELAPGDEAYADWRWIVTPWLRLAQGRAGLRFSGALGNNRGPEATTGGTFGGFEVIPSWWWIEDRLRLVARYEMIASQAPEGVAMGSRYAKRAGLPGNEDLPDLARGRGDFYQAIYGGLEWWPWPGHLSVLGGLEWAELRSDGREVFNGVTAWFATRVKF